MPLPSKNEGESPKDFMSRCMSSDKMKEEYKDQKQRTAICMSKACEGLNSIEASDFYYTYEETEGSYRYEDPKTGEIFIYKRRGIYKKNGRVLVYVGKDK